MYIYIYTYTNRVCMHVCMYISIPSLACSARLSMPDCQQRSVFASHSRRHPKDPGLVERQRDAAEHHRGGSTPGLQSKSHPELRVLSCMSIYMQIST